MPLSQVRHIFFDLDHTLWDFETNSTNALSSLYDSHDLAGRKIPNKLRFLDHYKTVNEYAWGRYREGKMTKAVLRTYRFEKTLTAFGVNDAVLAEKMASEYLEISPYQKTLMPGAIEVLEHLQSQYALHIITNGFEEVQHIKLEQSGLAPFFKEIITSEQVNARKPSPIIFDHSLKRGNCSAEESLIIGDNLEADILGGRAAGWKTIFYNPHQTPHNEKLEFEVAHLNELKALL